LALTEQERESFQAQIREELEAEHERRLENVQRQQERRRRRLTNRQQQAMEAEKSALREKERKRFYEEKGYKIYTDSAPAAAAARSSARAPRSSVCGCARSCSTRWRSRSR
jgi:hypothetical protein